jgi:hypothetical protein
MIMSFQRRVVGFVGSGTSLAIALLLLACARQPGRERSVLDAQAGEVAYVNRQYADCAKLFAQAAESATGRARADYVSSAGQCELRNGNRAPAMDHLRRAMQFHPSYYDEIVNSAHVSQELADDPAWKAIVATFKPRFDEYLASLNAELRDIFFADQRDREGGFDQIDWSVVKGRDAARRDRVRQLAAADQLRSADDYYFAAMIFQHGEDEASYDQAFRYATRAVEMDASFVKARWLAAASKDRYHVARGEPQLYGTQYKRVEGKWLVWPVDFHVTDAERAEWGVAPLETAKKRLEKMNAKANK